MKLPRTHRSKSTPADRLARVREAAARIKVGKTALYAALAQTASEYIEGLP